MRFVSLASVTFNFYFYCHYFPCTFLLTHQAQNSFLFVPFKNDPSVVMIQVVIHLSSPILGNRLRCESNNPRLLWAEPVVELKVSTCHTCRLSLRTDDCKPSLPALRGLSSLPAHSPCDGITDLAHGAVMFTDAPRTHTRKQKTPSTRRPSVPTSPPIPSLGFWLPGQI